MGGKKKLELMIDFGESSFLQVAFRGVRRIISGLWLRFMHKNFPRAVREEKWRFFHLLFNLQQSIFKRENVFGAINALLGKLRRKGIFMSPFMMFEISP